MDKGEKTKCDICGKRVKNIDEHIRTKHPEIADVECPHCHKEVPEKEIYNHIKTDHGEEALRSDIVELSRLRIGKRTIAKAYKDRKKLEQRVNILSEKKKSLEGEYETLNSNYENLNSNYETLQRKYETLQRKYETAKKEYEPCIKECESKRREESERKLKEAGIGEVKKTSYLEDLTNPKYQ